MPTSTKCRAKGGAANCADPNCPEKRATQEAFYQDMLNHEHARLASSPISYEDLRLADILTSPTGLEWWVTEIYNGPKISRIKLQSGGGATRWIRDEESLTGWQLTNS